MANFTLADNPPQIHPGEEIADLAAAGGVWFLIQTNHNREKKAAWELMDKGIGFYMPMIRSRNEQRQLTFLPLFPRYLFAVVPFGEITDLRSKHIWKAEAVHEEWLLLKELADIKQGIDSGRIQSLDDLAPGQFARVIGGTFTGTEGRIERIDHRRGLAFIAANGKQIEVPVAAVEAA